MVISWPPKPDKRAQEKSVRRDRERNVSLGQRAARAHPEALRHTTHQVPVDDEDRAVTGGLRRKPSRLTASSTPGKSLPLYGQTKKRTRNSHLTDSSHCPHGGPQKQNVVEKKGLHRFCARACLVVEEVSGRKKMSFSGT